jgi:tRNA (guanine10-N2)-dimethyltransferase
MDIVIETSKQCPQIALYEAERVLGSIKAYGSYAVSSTDQDFTRLSYANRAHQLLFICREEELTTRINSYDWTGVIAGSFSIRSDKASREKPLASLIWNRLKSPKVSLENPEIRIFFLHHGNEVIAARLLWENEKGFMQRRAHMRPRLHPSSLHPRLARACVNMAGLSKGSLLDPFCGSGGILIEAAFLGFRIIGVDIDRQMVERAIENLKHYGFTGSISQGDALLVEGNYDAIVTDLPYGKNTAIYGDLYSQFFDKSYDLSIKAVIMIPESLEYRNLLGRWRLEREFTYYLHGSLSKRILVLSH